MKKIPAHFENRLKHTARRAGVQRLIVGAVIPGAKSVLVLERAADDFMPGILELPSGQVEPYETLTDALMREVLEETGLEVVDIGDFLGSFDYLSKSGSLSRQFNFVTAVIGGSIRLSEHASHTWLTKDELMHAWITDSTRNTIRAFMQLAG